jgi:hypothetical protein
MERLSHISMESETDIATPFARFQANYRLGGLSGETPASRFSNLARQLSLWTNALLKNIQTPMRKGILGAYNGADI